MNPELRQRLEAQIQSSEVVLFMKGTRSAPQCGFSATVIQILDSMIDEYATVNVLADGELREGIKEYSDWPTIPQLYVKGEFVGGCDIVKDMYASGQLQESLGVEVQEVAAPKITVSASAAEAFASALQTPGEFVRLEVDAKFNHGLSIGPKGGSDLVVDAGPVQVLVDRGSAKRAEGVSIDFVETPDGKAFKIDNPNEPAKVRPIGVLEVKARLERAKAASERFHFYDVRTPAELAIAQVVDAQLMDREAQTEIMALPKTTPLYLMCHHGTRSAQAADFFINQGFKEVYNVSGGIDAWSQEVDPTVARYQ
ncbi:MAG: hypothetical protein RJA70_4565 [Pseudomonadota bacterium]|jgi:monothiol glutaredoxin